MRSVNGMNLLRLLRKKLVMTTLSVMNAIATSPVRQIFTTIKEDVMATNYSIAMNVKWTILDKIIWPGIEDYLMAMLSVEFLRPPHRPYAWRWSCPVGPRSRSSLERTQESYLEANGFIIESRTQTWILPCQSAADGPHGWIRDLADLGTLREGNTLRQTRFSNEI